MHHTYQAISTPLIYAFEQGSADDLVLNTKYIWKLLDIIPN